MTSASFTFFLTASGKFEQKIYGRMNERLTQRIFGEI